MLDFLGGIKVSEQVGGLVVLGVFGMFAILWLTVRVASQFDKRLVMMTETIHQIAGQFQGQAEQFRLQVNEMDRRNYERNIHYQEQFETLVDNYVRVSRESIGALAKIEAAIQSHSSRFTALEMRVGVQSITTTAEPRPNVEVAAVPEIRIPIPVVQPAKPIEKPSEKDIEL